jgi:C4-dicarboxylate-specific signal transduction histidine kinase
MTGLVESNKGGRISLVIGGVLLAADAFGLDLVLGPGFPLGILYALIVVPGLWWPDRSFIITAAVAGTVLCLIGFYFSLAGGNPEWKEIANLGIAIFTIWIVTALCLFHQREKTTTLKLQTQNDRLGQEHFAMKNVLDETRAASEKLEKETREKLDALEKDQREKLQIVEKNSSLLQLNILEKEAHLDQVEQTLKEQETKLTELAQGQGKGEEEFDRLQASLDHLLQDQANAEELLKGRDARLTKSEEARNRTAGALWEKEQRLMEVLDDLSLLENDIKDKTASMDHFEKSLEHARGQLQERDDRLRTLEVRLDTLQEELENKNQHLESLENNIRTIQSKHEQAQKNFRDRESLLQNIGQQIHASLTDETEVSEPTKPGEKPCVPDEDFAQNSDEQNGNTPEASAETDENSAGEKAQEKFNRYTQELERSNEDLSEFAAIASHDLKEPIRKIIGFGQRLKKDCSSYLDDKGKDYLERMARSAEKMQTFVDDLLQYSKTTASPPKHQQVNLKNVISQVLTVLEARIEETHAQIEVDSLPVVAGDRMQMEQLLQNLIANALKFHKKGEPPVVRISHRLLDNGFHEICVRDQGIGFDEKDAERIFKPFERLQGNSEYAGTGMGLAICQKIVQRNGGQLTAISSPKEGTAFTVTLPA